MQLIHRVQKERVPFGLHDVPGFPGAKRVGSGERVTIAVAAFPNGHPRSRSRAQDIDTLLAKEAAGANLAITQLFFHADEYLAFVDEARAAGVTMRILPGIMPVVNPQRLVRIVELAEETIPADLMRLLEASDDPVVQRRVGIGHATALVQEVLDGGADGIHLYTYNRHQEALDVLRGVELITADALKEHVVNRTSLPVVITGLFAAALLLAGCAPTTPESTPVPEATADGGCAEVSVVVDFGVLDEPPIAECVSAGIAVECSPMRGSPRPAPSTTAIRSSAASTSSRRPMSRSWSKDSSPSRRPARR